MRALFLSALISCSLILTACASPEEKACRNVRSLGGSEGEGPNSECAEELSEMEESCPGAYPAMVECMAKADTVQEIPGCMGGCLLEGVGRAFQEGLGGALDGLSEE